MLTTSPSLLRLMSSAHTPYTSSSASRSEPEMLPTSSLMATILWNSSLVG
ncbi:MAG: hypothetical protein IJO87_09250 [Eggerthellaceae bacterium]|nr:hypothetical protein [Eggerthellaceae bacterium]